MLRPKSAKRAPTVRIIIYDLFWSMMRKPVKNNVYYSTGMYIYIYEIYILYNAYSLR